MSWHKSSTDSLHPVVFTPPELRQILSAYSEGVLKKQWKDYGFQTAPGETAFIVVERAEQSINNAILCSIKKNSPQKTGKSATYQVYEGERSVLKTTSFLEALEKFRLLHPKKSSKKSGNLRLVRGK